MELVIAEKFAHKVLDREEIERVKALSSKNVGLGFAQGTQHKLEALLSSIRIAVKAYGESANSPGHENGEGDFERARQVFIMFDLDQNGAIEKSEFLVGCIQLGIQITKAEMDTLWPMLDVDMSGEIDIDEFLTMVKTGDRKHGNFLRLREERAARCAEVNKEQRLKKIKTRTALVI